MGLFQEIEGEAAIILEGGVFKQVSLHKRDGILYAKNGGGFIRLNEDGSTTKARCRLVTLDWANPNTLGRDIHGRLCITQEVEGARALSFTTQTNLLGGPA